MSAVRAERRRALAASCYQVRWPPGMAEVPARFVRRQVGHRLGSLVKPFSAKNCCSDAVKAKA
jgi:hypothetical protein